MSHQIVTAPALAAPVGYAHAVVAAPGRTVYLGGQTALGPDGTIHGDTIALQFDVAAGNVTAALRAAGGKPEDVVSLQVFVTDIKAYKSASRELGEVYRRHFGRHYPAMALIETTGLWDAEAMIELVGVAVVP